MRWLSSYLRLNSALCRAHPKVREFVVSTLWAHSFVVSLAIGSPFLAPSNYRPLVAGAAATLYLVHLFWIVRGLSGKS